MKPFLCVLTLTLTLPACAFFNRVKADTCPNAVQCATTILTDFKWGVDEAGTRLWLSAADVTIADSYVLVALDTVAATPGEWRTVVAATLNSIKLHVSQAEKWTPYINAALLVLSLSS